MASRGAYNYSLADANSAAANSGQLDAWTHPSQYGYTNSGIAYLSNSADSYVDAHNLEQQWLREDMLRKEGYQREDTAYTRLFNELKSLGVNPALLLDSAGITTGSANSASTASFKNSNYAANEKTQAANSAKMVGAIIAALAAIAVAVL